MRFGEPLPPGSIAPDKAAAETRRSILSTLDEFRSQAVAVTRLAERHLVIYTGRLEPEIYEHPAFVEAFKRLILARSFARVRILVAEAGPLLDMGHPLATIAARLPSMVDIRIMPDDQYDASGFIVADEAAVVYRMHCTRWDGIAELHDPAIAKMYLDRFDRVWPVAASMVTDAEQLWSA